MTPDPHPPVMSDDDYSDDDFESASEGEQERDSDTEGPVRAKSSVHEPVQHAPIKQQTVPLHQTPPPQPSPSQQTQQQQQVSQKPMSQQQQQQQQQPQSSISPLSHPSSESDALRNRPAAGAIVALTSPHASIDSPPAHTPARVQERTLSQKNLDEALTSTPPPMATPGYPKQFATPGTPFQPLAHSLTDKPPLFPSFSGTQQQQPSRPQQQFFGSSQSPHPSQNQHQNGARQPDPYVPGKNKQQQETGRGWGSLGSWINTAVSTVSEVIENPNVVVSKAHTIGQGIRNVATEQIDRVYESLDPVYEYERERQKQQQPSQWPTQQQPHSAHQGKHIPQQPQQLHDEFASRSSSERFAQPKNEARKDDISDLLQSSHSPTQHSHLLTHSSPNANKDGDAHNGPMQGKLAYNEDAVNSSVDAWGDDAWGDEWDDQADIDKVKPTMEPSATVKQPTLPTQPTTPQPSDKIQEKNAFDLQPLHADRQQDILRPSSRNGQSPLESGRNVKDLFGSPRSGGLSQGQGSRTAYNLSVPLSADSLSADSPSQRRPSADLRPADALFSTLDFASNAIGSAVLGVHRKVTQAGQTQQQKNGGLEYQQARSASPAWGTPQRRESGDSGKEVLEKMDRLALSNPTLEAVGGNVVSTGLGALEILGKRAVDVISDVRRAGHLSHGQGAGGASDVFDEQNSFRVPPRMSVVNIFEESGGKSHLVSLRSLASAASTRVDVITTSRPDFLNAGQLDDLEQLLDRHALDTALKEPTTDLLAGHKDFRAMVALLEQMGVQGTTHLRQLRNCTRKLSTLVPDNVNAFEQEWHNHQTRASEKDFFAKGPIKKFFESRLLTVYFDGLRALAQFTDKTCDQILRLAENFNIRVAEKSSNASSPNDGDDASRLATLALAKILQQFVGSLIAETKFISKQYRLSLEAILQTAKGLTTPLDNLDWEDLAMGLDKIKALLKDTETVEAIGFVHSGALCVLEVLRNDLMIDIAYGTVAPSPRKPRSRHVVQATPAKPTQTPSVSRPGSKPTPPSSISSVTAASGGGRRLSAASSDQGVGLSSPRITPSPRISPMNRISPSPSLKPSPGLQGGQPHPSFSPSLRSATVAQPGQPRSSLSPALRPSPSPSSRPVQQVNPQGQGQGLSSRLAPSPSLRPAQAIGQPRPPMMARPKTPVSQSSSAVSNRGSPVSEGAPQNSNPHSYSLYPRPPPAPRPPVKEEEDFFSMLNGA